MAIVTISRGSHSRGEEIAETVARRLGYECVAREALLEAAAEFDIPEAKMLRAFRGAPSILDRFTDGRQKQVAYAQCALTQRAKKDNIVYHGLAGHFLLPGITHVLKVRVAAGLHYRAVVVLDREDVSRDEALRILAREDEDRNKWGRRLYGVEESDASLYDLAINIDSVAIEKAVDLICHVACLEGFRTTPESQKAIEDLALACYVRSRLVSLKPDIEVRADDGVVIVMTGMYPSLDDVLTREMRGLVARLPGVKEVHIVSTSAPDMTG